MLYPDLMDIPFEVFGGYCPAIPPANLAPGAAAIAQDVIFPQAAVRTRGGLANFFTVNSPIPNNAAINGLKSYVTPSLNQRMMAWDSLGNLYKESPQGTLNLLFTRPYQNLFYQSQTLFGREYQAFFNSLGGFDIPRQYDDTNWDRVSQQGPGLAPIAADLIATFNIVASPNGLLPIGQSAPATITNITQAGALATVTCTGNPFQSPSSSRIVIKPGDLIQIAGNAVSGYNATWTVKAVINSNVAQFIVPTAGLGTGAGGTLATGITEVVINTAQIWFNPLPGQLVTVAGAGVGTYNGTFTLLDNPVLNIGPNTADYFINVNAFGLAASGGGTFGPAGNVSAGLHQISVAFITRQGLITQAAVPASFNASGNHALVVSNIPTGPSNVVARLLLFTPAITPPAVTGSFFSIPNGSQQVFGSTMLINDNITTITVVDFTDTILQANFAANYLFSQIELGEPSFMIGYNSRTVWLGERSRISNFIPGTLSFDGGFSGSTPNGWTLDAANGAGAGSAVTGGFTADWGDAYAITGDGATAIRGKITQSAFKDYLGVAIIGANVSYSVRARIARNNTLAAGTLHIVLQSTSGAFTTVGLAVTAAQAGLAYAEFTAVLTSNGPLSSPPSDLLLQVYADGTPTNGGVFLVDSIEVFGTNTPFNYSIGRFSHAFNPESFDAVTGQVQIRTNDGQQLRAGFPLRNNLYLAKDHYLCYVQDDGVNEPASWPVNEVSATVGICGGNAVDWTEEWAVFGERSGLYITWGSDPVKITPEIQIDASGTGKISWASINWAAAFTMWVRIDRANKMILVGAPVNGATTPNVVFMLDYRWLETAADIANSPLVTYSAFTGKMLAHGRGRRWALWSITANSMTFAERSDGTAQPFFGNGVGNGKIYQQRDCAVQGSDDGVAIPWDYQGYGCPSHMEEQGLQLGAHRKLLGYIKFRAIGNGLLPLGISTTLRSTLLRSYTLSTSPAGDGERPINIKGERFFPNIGTNSVAGNWFQLEKLILCMRKDATTPVRGVSA